MSLFFFFFNDTATTEIYTLSLHDALPIYDCAGGVASAAEGDCEYRQRRAASPRGRNPAGGRDRKSTRLNSSHSQISYAVFCLKKKKKLDRNCHHPRDPDTAVPVRTQRAQT